MKQPLIVYWSRRDFRINDNPALTAALTEHQRTKIPVLPLFILEHYMTAGDPAYQFGLPSRIFLSKALPQFAAQFPIFLCAHDRAVTYFKTLSERYDLKIFVNEDVYPDFYTQVEKIKAQGISISVCADMLTISKETRTKEGNIYSVFTPFKKAVWNSFVTSRPLARPKFDSAMFVSEEMIKTYEHRVLCTEASLLALFSETRLFSVGGVVVDLSAYTLVPVLEEWYTNEAAAMRYFLTYLSSGLHDLYAKNRDSLEGDVQTRVQKKVTLQGYTSRMSLALAWGLVSSRMLLAQMRTHYDEAFDNPFSNRVSQGALSYISELLWREFYKYLFYHHPQLLSTEFQEKFRGTIEWVADRVARERFIHWIKGETGYPVVDAAMHQIATTGWMHNRARMIVASILTKNLGVDWRWGQEYFRAALIDIDEASNNGGWQWAASVGADPKPIRIFNPELQAKNYDASGAYVRTWLSAESDVLRGERMPLIEHAAAREEALRRYGLLREAPRDY